MICFCGSLPAGLGGWGRLPPLPSPIWFCWALCLALTGAWSLGSCYSPWGLLFLGSMIPSRHRAGTSTFSQILLKRLCSTLLVVSMSAFMASAGTLSGPAAFPFLSVMMAFLISAFVGFLQLMGNSVSAGGMSGNNSGAGQFSSSLKCSAHHFSCSSTVISRFSSLSFTGMSVCWNLPASFLVVRYRSLKLPWQAAFSAWLAR